MAQMDKVSDDPDYGLPEIGPLEHIVAWLVEIGEAQQTGGGLATVTWQELRAWAAASGLTLSPFEYQALRRLSAAYVDQYYAAHGTNVASPCFEADRDRVEEKARSLFALLRRPET